MRLPLVLPFLLAACGQTVSLGDPAERESSSGDASSGLPAACSNPLGTVETFLTPDQLQTALQGKWIPCSGDAEGGLDFIAQGVLSFSDPYDGGPVTMAVPATLTVDPFDLFDPSTTAYAILIDSTAYYIYLFQFPLRLRLIAVRTGIVMDYVPLGS